MSRRGTRVSDSHRFTSEASEPFDDGWGDATDRFEPDPRTSVVMDASRKAFATNNSPDVPFTHSINPYRGCEHGCSYCYARPTHEYLNLNPGIDFESVILVKKDAALLARKEMLKSSWTPTTVSLSGVTDPYQPLERRFRITRSILETMLDFRNPVGIVTKNASVCRDIDLLQELARFGCVQVFLSITTLDPTLTGSMEPRTSRPNLRLRAVRALADAGVPVGVMAAPIIPGLNDRELPAILKSAADAGAEWASHVVLRLPYSVKEIFVDWLRREQPGRARKVVNAIREMKGDSLNETTFGDRMSGTGTRAESLSQLFHVLERRYGLNERDSPLTTRNFRRPGVPGQTSMFD